MCVCVCVCVCVCMCVCVCGVGRVQETREPVGEGERGVIVLVIARPRQCWGAQLRSILSHICVALPVCPAVCRRARTRMTIAFASVSVCAFFHSVARRGGAEAYIITPYTITPYIITPHARTRACMHACVHACVRACMHAHTGMRVEGRVLTHGIRVTQKAPHHLHILPKPLCNKALHAVRQRA